MEYQFYYFIGVFIAFVTNIYIAKTKNSISIYDKGIIVASFIWPGVVCFYFFDILDWLYTQFVDLVYLIICIVEFIVLLMHSFIGRFKK